MRAEQVLAWVLIVPPLAFGVWEADKYYFAADKTIQSIIEPCEQEASKVFALEVARWKIEHGTDAFNPYRRERDKAIENCVAKEGSWCPIKNATDIWPCSMEYCFIPTGTIARWIYNKRYEGREVFECK